MKTSHTPLNRLGLTLLLCAAALGADAAEEAADARHRTWIEAMKTDARGPFSGIRWYCSDGTVLPPEPYACRPHGGGHEHGEWSERTRDLRQRGFYVATLLAGIDPPAVIAESNFREAFRQLLVERYLMAVDDGWIFRRALFYRGAIQEEDERDGARRLLLDLAARPDWTDVGFPLLRMGVRYLPHGKDSPSVQRVRQLSASLSDRDDDFHALRAKIHGAPDAADAERVRHYAATLGDGALRREYEKLASEIDAIYRAEPLGQALREVARQRAVARTTRSLLEAAADELASDSAPPSAYRVTAGLLAGIRDQLEATREPRARLDLLDLSLRIEAEHFRAGAALTDALSTAPRAERVRLLAAASEAAYGTGLLKRRELEALQNSTSRLAAHDSASLAEYIESLRYLGRAPGWAAANLRFHFDTATQKLTRIEPKADLFLPDQLRGSPMLAYSRVIDTLARDADRLAEVRHRLLDEDVGVGFRALNPGLSRGTLHTRPNMSRVEDFEPEGIYLLPETVAELPPVAGILTTGEGNPISHVQLLARNLGIPNVSVDRALVDRLRTLDGAPVVLAASPGGVVELLADGPEWDSYFDDASEGGDVVIRPDLEKLDLSVRDFVNLDALRASDSGRIVGPKAAKLGELRHAFPDRVAPGIAIPFGMFRTYVLDVPAERFAGSRFDWMVSEFRRIEALPATQQAAAYEALRDAIYALIEQSDPGADFRDALRRQMEAVFGSIDDVGVFIRSDTNVEDLPGFTGAGLNLTLPNVVGFDAVMRGLASVWASPFTRRAFAWRNSHMEGPEHVYPAVLLLKTVPAEKSGVMITADVDTGNRDVLSVAVNEGVGGAVEGQAAESLRIDRRSGAVTLLATATAVTRHVPRVEGGVIELPASGSDAILTAAEIRELVSIADEIPRRFPPIVDERGVAAPADIEFAFVDGRLQLLQIRPFLESRKAKGSSYLATLDRGLERAKGAAVDLTEAPR